MDQHRLLDQIGSGYGDEASIEAIVDAELSITRALVAAVADLAAHPVAEPGWRLLTEIDRSAPGAVRAVLGHPYVRAWAVQCLARPGENTAYLSQIAAACAHRAQVPAQVPVLVRDGWLYLPTVGTLRVPARGSTSLTVTPDQFVVAGAEVARQPVRWLGTDGATVSLDDGDPYRDCHKWMAAGRLDEPVIEDWRRTVGEAWQMIRDEAPGYLPGLRKGLRVIVPLQADSGGQLRASTARNAFGAVAAAPAPAPALAVMLVHEFQHGKLGALLDLCDLVDPEDRSLTRVGWRPDPRPVEGVLQGTYAHLAVADIWRVRAARTRDAMAGATFRQYRDWTTAAVDALGRGGALTPAGATFVDRMAGTLAAWSE